MTTRKAKYSYAEESVYRRANSCRLIIQFLQQAEKGVSPISEVCRQHNVSQSTFYRWRTRFGGMNAPDTARIRDLEKENARLKHLLAERDLEVDIIKELLQKK